jgi:hypothetical protein
MANLRVRLLVREVNAKLLSYADDGATEMTWPWRDVDDEFRPLGG